MTTVTTIMLVLHIITGFIALGTGFISMLNRKGAKSHRITGKLFFVAMTGVFITAVFISIVKSLAFLFMVGFFSYYLACSGYRILHVKKLQGKQVPSRIDWTISGIGILAGTGLILFSIKWFSEQGAWGFVPLAFGTTCLSAGIQDIRSFFYVVKNKYHRISTHGGRMGGSFAATVTAFIVTNVNIGTYSWVLWILPGVLVGIWISFAVKRFLKPKKNTQLTKVLKRQESKVATSSVLTTDLNSQI